MCTHIHECIHAKIRLLCPSPVIVLANSGGSNILFPQKGTILRYWLHAESLSQSRNEVRGYGRRQLAPLLVPLVQEHQEHPIVFTLVILGARPCEASHLDDSNESHPYMHLSYAQLWVPRRVWDTVTYHCFTAFQPCF